MKKPKQHQDNICIFCSPCPKGQRLTASRTSDPLCGTLFTLATNSLPVLAPKTPAIRSCFKLVFSICFLSPLIQLRVLYAFASQVLEWKAGCTIPGHLIFLFFNVYTYSVCERVYLSMPLWVWMSMFGNVDMSLTSGIFLHHFRLTHWGNTSLSLNLTS